MKSQDTIVKDLVLIGGGHSHVAVLKMFGMKPMPGVRITVIARDVHTPYSGMLPGYVAGHYDFDDVHIDLRPLSQFAGARLYHDEAIRIDHVNKKVICKNRPPVSYDLLSVNIGSTPRVTGAAELGTPVKPINRFVRRWERLSDRIMENPGPHKIAIVGAGAAGVEILLAIQFRLKNMLKDRGRDSEELEFHLVSKTETIMPQFPASVGQRFERVLKERGVIVHRGREAEQTSAGTLELVGGETLKLDEILWVTAAGAAPWLKESGLAVDEHGFVSVKDTLESTSHPGIFAVGDIADVVNHPRPKAGVFAVRQGKPLAKNLRRVLLGKSPVPFAPQKTILALISTGDKYAVATKGAITFAGDWVWKWKDWIDVRFMTKFSDLPEMDEDEKSNLDSRLADQDTLKEISAIAMRCGGCGAKVGANVLTRALSELKPVERPDVLIGLHEPDDAAVLEVPPGKVLVNTVDYFRAFIDDPYIFGKVAANHSLSDVFAMGAEAQSALAIATVPYGIESKVEDTINQLMAGAMEILADANCALVGGHTSEGAELALGFSVNGLADKSQIMRKGGMKPGDLLILTKPLGTGTLFAADMQQKAKGRWVEEALRSMVLSNRRAAECLYGNDATACTDVTGFGLLGHMVEMIKPSGVDVEVELKSLPILDGAMESVRAGILSTLQPANVRLRRAIRNMDEAVTSELYPLVFDPQTSGGLLASVPDNRAGTCLNELRDMGYDKAAIVGRVKPESNNLEPVTLVV
ncbi:MAG: selenide, water dikinase SelD [Rhodospirillaceae bacterium]|jgi:selenide,water dikinase|nr:selenide, water dikinase SelD [Rhodospirillaceae bacterium]MBT5034562.1 selenide, water dikinase SelD [Rhodospirillaceae bacterium]MBT6362334.1 selenide, water dikinase SelD [Rhodospirillaceae bacterium]MBT7770860.1 selenide, water dikinase SelD [Rhodospirillales bacterium]